MDCLKNITIKDVIFWVADAWNTVKLSCHRKSLCPLLDIMSEEDLTQNISSEDEYVMHSVKRDLMLAILNSEIFKYVIDQCLTNIKKKVSQKV